MCLRKDFAQSVAIPALRLSVFQQFPRDLLSLECSVWLQPLPAASQPCGHHFQPDLWSPFLPLSACGSQFFQ